jgi:hypothetical protein
LLKRLQNPSMVDIIDDMSYDEDKWNDEDK